MIPSHGTTDHDAAMALAAAAIDWSLSAEDEKALEKHLQACPACRGRVAALQADARSLRLLDLGDAPRQVANRVAIHAGKTLRRERGMSRGTALLAAAAVLLVTIAGSILGGVGGRSGEPGDPAEPTPRFVVESEVVRLVATEFWIDADGKRFVGSGRVSVTSEPGGGDAARTLELTWFEHDREMRLTLGLRTDGQLWWVDEVRTYDGRAQPDWVTADGRFLIAAVGTEATGDLDVVLTSGRGAMASLHIGGMTLATATFEGGTAGAADQPVPVGASPFDRGGVLHCSGILQMSPSEAEQTLRGLAYRVRWQLNQSPSVILDSLSGIVDPVIVFPGAMPHPDGTLVLWILPSGNPNAEAMPFPSDCPPPPEDAP